MIRFVSTEQDGTGQKRKQVARACEACRIKKKRCDHLPGAAPERRKRKVSHADRLVHHDGGSPSQMTPESSQVESATEDSTWQTNGTAAANEAADPEDIFHAAMRQISSSGGHCNDKIWLERKESLHSDPQSTTGNRAKSIYQNMPTIVQAVMPYVQAESLNVLPSEPNCKALLDIYQKKIHPILPVLDLDFLQRAQESTPALTMLIQAGCLVAAKDPAAKTHLLLPGSDDGPLPPQKFADKIFAALKVALDLGMVKDAVVLIQVYSLMAFHVSGDDGYDEIARMSGQAVHYSYTIGLHTSRRRCKYDEEYLDTLLCCVWTIDKLVANLCGRPCLMHERDFDKDLSSCRDKQVPAFRLKIRITKLMENVMQNYDRMNTNLNRGPDIPAFEHLTQQCDAGMMKPHVLGYLELYYHVVKILACGSSSPSSSPFTSPSKVATDNPNSTLARQIDSASRISTIVGNIFPGQLAFTPMLPHGLALSLSVAHVSLRHSKTTESRARARKAFEMNCNLLESLKTQFWLAEAMAKLGRMTLMEIDNSRGSASSSGGGKTRTATNKNINANSLNRARTVTKVVRRRRSSNSTGGFSNYEMGQPSTDSTPGQTIINFSESNVSVQSNSMTPLFQQPMNYNVTPSDFSLQQQSALGFEQGLPQQTMFDHVYPYLNFDAMVDPWWSSNGDMSSFQGPPYSDMDLG